MSDTYRSRDYFQMRQLAKQMQALIPNGITLAETKKLMAAPQYKALERKFDRLWAKYGFRSMVMDKARRNSTRRANKKHLAATRRAEKRTETQSIRLALIRELAQSPPTHDA